MSHQHSARLVQAWSVLANPGVGRWLRSTMKLSRALGAAVVLVTHTLGDFEAVGDASSEAARLARHLVSETSARAVLAQPDVAVGEVAALLGLSGPETDLLPRLARGRALWHLGADGAALVRHIVPGALAGLVDTDARMRAS